MIKPGCNLPRTCNRVHGHSKCRKAVRNGSCPAVCGQCVGRSSVFDLATESMIRAIRLPEEISIIPPTDIVSANTSTELYAIDVAG